MQRLRDHLDRLTGEEHLVDPLHDGCFFRHDFRLLIFAFSVAEEIFVLKAYFSLLELLSIRPCDMLADALGFRLRETRINDKVQFTLVFQRVNVLFFKEDANALRF